MHLLFPLLCYSSPIFKVGYETELADTKQLFMGGEAVGVYEAQTSGARE